MATSTNFTQGQLNALTNAIALGVKRTEHNGKVTEFQTTAQMLDLRDRMIAELARAEAVPGAPMPCMTRPTIFLRG